VIPSVRPHTAVTVKVASPGHNEFLASAERSEAPVSLWSNGNVRDERPLHKRIGDVVERFTWTAINTNPSDVVKVTELPRKLWDRRAQLPQLVMEKGVSLVMRQKDA